MKSSEDIKKIRGIKSDKLSGELSDETDAYRSVRLSIAGRKSKEVHQSKNKRRRIARIQTVIYEQKGHSDE